MKLTFQLSPNIFYRFRNWNSFGSPFFRLVGYNFPMTLIGNNLHTVDFVVYHSGISKMLLWEMFEACFAKPTSRENYIRPLITYMNLVFDCKRNQTLFFACAQFRRTIYWSSSSCCNNISVHHSCCYSITTFAIIFYTGWRR